MPENDQLTVIQPNNTALAAAVQSSWGDEEEKVEPRYIRLKNPKSTVLEAYKNGHFVDHAVGRSWDTIHMVILGVRLTRKLQSPYDEANPKQREVHCRSVNRITPVTTDNRFTPPAETCNTCAYGQLAWARWRETKAKEDVPKNACEMEVEILFIDKANPKQPYIYIINDSQGRDAAEKMYKALKDRSKDVLDRTGRRPEVYEYIVTMTSERKTGGNYAPKFTEIAELTPEQAAKDYGEAYQMFVLARRQAFEAMKNAAATQSEAGVGEQKVVETPAQPATKPTVDPEYLPPASKRVAGTRPVYTPPTIDAKAEVVQQDVAPVESSEEPEGSI